MIHRMLLIMIVIAAVTIAGCKGKDKEPVEPSGTTEVKITEENLDAELDKMEAEIEADIAAEEQ